MKKLYIILIILNTLLSANSIDNAYSWIDQEYKDFRTYPRVAKAQNLLKEEKVEEAKKLLKKALEIDSENQGAIDTLLTICLQEKDEICIQKYLNKTDKVELGYYYKEKADKAKKREDYTNAITFSKKALAYKLKDKDKKFIKLVLFESYLKSGQYHNADELINREKSDLYNIFKWSKISKNLNEINYAYSLAKELPNKKEYVKWKIELLLEKKNYLQASKELEILNKIEPTEENKKQLLYLYSLTGQNSKILKDYRKKLTKGCDRYALKSLLYHYRNNKKKRATLLEKNYPFSCLKKSEKVNLSLELIQYLKDKNPKKAKLIANRIDSKIINQKKLINLYQNTGQKNKILKIYKNRLEKGCDEYALNFILDYYKNNKKRRKSILEKAYPYSCMTPKKRTSLSLELIELLDKKDKNKIILIIENLDKKSIKPKSLLYLSNLESTLGNYQKSIEYAKSYLKYYPNNVEAIKNIGFSYFKLNNKDLAIHYLMKASKLAPKEYTLLKNIGYLCMDLGNYNAAAYYWNLYLNHHVDSKIALELASLYYYKLKKPKEASRILKKYEKSTQNYPTKYYVLKTKLLDKKEDCKKRLNYYTKALNLKKDKYLQYEQIHLLQQCHKEKQALRLMEKFVKNYPNNLQYQKELAFMYSQNKKYTKAIVQLKKIKEKEPQKVENYTNLAFNYKKIGHNQKVIDTFKEAIDKSKNMSETQRKNIKREITNKSKKIHLYLSQSPRLNAYNPKSKTLSPVDGASYNGFGSMQLSYQPNSLPKNTTLYANVTHAHKNVKESIQPSIGVRYKPLKDKKIYLSAEQLIKGGRNSRNDTLLRASLGISGEPKSSTHENLYIEGAYLAKANAAIFYGNYEYGKKIKTDENIYVTPYITTGATYNNDNRHKKSVTKMDVGVGVSIDMLSGESQYEIGKYRNKLKLEARQKYAGNSNDKQTLRLQWEFFY